MGPPQPGPLLSKETRGDLEIPPRCQTLICIVDHPEAGLKNSVTQNSRQKVVNRELYVCAKGLYFCAGLTFKFDKNSTD